MSTKPHQLTTPVGRLVGGSLYEPRTTDYDGKPLVVKTGANIGKPRVEFSFGVAFPKTPGVTHWAQEAWLLPIWNLAHAAFPNGEAQRTDFAWKITDGDSTIPNKRGKKPVDAEGYRGHWVVWFSGGIAPRIYNANGTQQILEKDAVKPGYFVQVFGNVTDNKPSASPGLYINHSMIALAGYGEEIVFGPDVSAAGFGNAPLPAGASTTPPAGMTAAPAGAPPVPGAAIPAGAPPVPGAVAPLVNIAPPVPVAPARVMLPAAGGYTYEQLMATGQWTDALLVQHGMMAPTAAAVVTPPVPVPLAAPAGSVPTGSAPVPVAPVPTTVTPSAQFVQVPGTAMPAPPAPPVVVPARLMLPAAGGYTYEQMIATGQWTDALLVQHGMMAA